MRRAAWVLVGVLCLGMPFTAAAQGGDRESTLRHGGLDRAYVLHVPAAVSRAPALVLAFHGGYGTGRGMVTLTGFNDLADRAGFLVAYPDGIERHWADGRGTTPPDRQQIDDVGFVSALIAELVRSHGVDPRRVYATGASNGGIFSHRLGCALSEKIAAVGPVAGTLAEPFAPRCQPRQSVSVIAFHGTEDLFVPWDGGVVRGSIAGRVLSVADTMARWAALNRCPSTVQRTVEPDRDSADGTRVRRETYGPCPGGAEVVLYAIEGGGHTWPGGPGGRLAATGRVSREINATELLWQFFAAHPRR